ncbi:MAG: hypothetical protein ABIS50_13650 [Luteolibacter sp.]|uniref:hypothetical protein n=1 Tax=Luteolibacter sp. TaxID=1962973 RepID=UPI00326376F3
MKALLILVLVAFHASCAAPEHSIPRLPNYEVDYGSSPKLTAERGRLDAKRHIDQGALRIIRYDMPLVRTGFWDAYWQPFIDLGIQEVPSVFDSLEYCRAYNAVMDLELKRRFGNRYRAVRQKILPPPKSKHFMQENSVLAEPKHGT